ncbi:phosphoenolpyruvate--protein phosphotransferase [Caproicibacter sp.]|uniref:phosphoenolpyruvate--protein phosphotransferase n=1 Tax=Caproicibacter sp. TaxID=2814884 RepID=UPI00398A2C9C
MKVIKGLAGASGYAAGRAAVFSRMVIPADKKKIEDPETEITALESARSRYVRSLGLLAERARREHGEQEATIFEAYREIASDDVFFDEIKEKIRTERVDASWAIEQKRSETESVLDGLDDPYLKTRKDDVNNVCREVTAELQGAGAADPIAEAGGDDLIVFAEDLTPADTVRLDRTRLKGMVTEKGGVTSHTVILAKLLGIPAIVGTGPMLSEVKNGDEVLADGGSGTVVLSPDTAGRQDFLAKQKKAGLRESLYAECRAKPARTRDGFSVRVDVNSGDKESIEKFNADECDGVGLFRTEFLYMGQKDYPSEEFQFQVYRGMAEKAGGKELIIRTLDIGGDKQLDYMDLPKESNPFLGFRAIRICLSRPELFQTQLRAILRAGVYGNVKIMFPMIVNLEELLQAKTQLETAKRELDRRQIAYRKDIPVGIMVETPAAVLLSDILAKHVSFFSIGSNDLIQYTTATDRMNERVQYLYDSCNLSVLRSIRTVCRNAHANGVQVGICGETASEPRLIPLWCALGVNELSVAPPLVGRTKYIVGQVSKKEMEERAEKLLASGSVPEAKQELSEILGELGL